MFSVKKSPTSSIGPRLGTLRLPGRKPIETPHYIAITSRGAVPHLSQDNFAKQTDLGGVYVALEDFLEKVAPHVPPIYRFQTPDGSSPLRRFIALSEDNVLVLGARRTPPITCPGSSTHTTIPLLTSVGFRSLSVDEYIKATQKLQPDIVVGLGDVPFGAETISRKKVDKITDRTARWMQEQVTRQVQDVKDDTVTGTLPALFAPLLPLHVETQKWYLDRVIETLVDRISGLAVYKDFSLLDLPIELQALPRLGFTEPNSPRKLLAEIAQGIDVATIPFIGAATDAGIALDFSFPIKSSLNDISTPQPLGVDMWQTSHATDVSPLQADCECYTCTKHHRAYLQHLLMAKEMLGWVLLQIHNHHILDRFFAGVRESIANDGFEQDTSAFLRMYEPELPEKTGQGPRVRGYQYKSDGPGEVKRNAPAYRNLDDGKQGLADPALPDPGANAEELEAQGFAEKI